MTSIAERGSAGRSTFRRYARRLEAHRLVERGAITEAELIEAVEAVDEAVAAVEGRGFEVTPFAPQPELARAVGLDPSVELWVKDETGNVSGTHKARHLFGVALAHRLAEATPEASHHPGDSRGPGAIRDSGDSRGSEAPRDPVASRGPDDSRGSEAPYAIASCGNAALAAAVLARAVGRALDVYVPVWANPAVVDHITELGGRVVRCPRADGVLGDPAHHAMQAAVAAGAVPFSCQGTDTPTTIDGARTLAYEMVDALAAAATDPGPAALAADPGSDALAADASDSGPDALAADAPDSGPDAMAADDRPGSARLDRVFVQVGGGALATALVTGLAACEGLDRLPVIHAVQPVGNHPLVRAWDRVAAEITGQPPPADNRARAAAAAGMGPLGDEAVRVVTARLAANPQRYMTPWETEPVSYATGILDDVAYDWTAVVEAMLRSGGHPVVAGEDDLRLAHRLARLHTGIDVCPTGAAGLGGLLALLAAGSGAPASLDAAAGLSSAEPDAAGSGTAADSDAAGSGGLAVRPGERVAVLFTGRLRPGDPDPLKPAASTELNSSG